MVVCGRRLAIYGHVVGARCVNVVGPQVGLTRRPGLLLTRGARLLFGAGVFILDRYGCMSMPVRETTRKYDVATALRLRVEERLTYREIAERLGVDESAVRQRLSRWLALVDDPDELAAYRAQRAAVFDSLESTIIRELWREIVAHNVSAGDLIRGLEVVAKHGRLVSGASTENVSVLVSSLTKLHTPEPETVAT